MSFGKAEIVTVRSFIMTVTTKVPLPVRSILGRVPLIMFFVSWAILAIYTGFFYDVNSLGHGVLLLVTTGAVAIALIGEFAILATIWTVHSKDEKDILSAGTRRVVSSTSDLGFVVSWKYWEITTICWLLFLVVLKGVKGFS